MRASEEEVRRSSRLQSVLNELTKMAKHQQAAIDELSTHHDRAVEELRSCRADLGAAQAHCRAEGTRADTLGADTEKLLARITGLEGIIRGLRDERSLWSRELVSC